MILFFKQRDLDLSHKLFLIGTFFLPSTFFIGSLFILFSTILNFLKDGKNFIKDRFNLSLVICSFFLLISTTVNIFSINEPFVEKNNWVSIFNWLPFFFVFWAFQKELDFPKKRELFCKSLIAGTIPVLFSGFNQYFLGWYGPYKFLNGLIVWHQNPLMNNAGATGLFNNPNYLASWLAISLPFSIYLFIKKNEKYNLLKKIISLLIIFFITYLIVLTSSRNGLMSIFISSSILFIKNSSLIFILSFILIFILTLISLIIYFSSLLNLPIYSFLSGIFGEIGINNISSIYDWPRLFIWRKSIFSIIDKPILGYGPGSSKYLIGKNLNIADSEYFQHSHNLFLELALNYGLIVSVIIFIILTSILIKSFIKIFIIQKSSQEYLLDQVWFVSTLFILINNLTDMTYYDGRLSIIFWILFSGLRGIMESRKT